MPEPNDSAKTREVIRELLSRGYPYTAYEVAGFLEITMKRRITESACTARIRDLRKPQFGGLIVKSRIRRGCRAGEYWIEANRNQEAA
jgi:hypothetical protein